MEYPPSSSAQLTNLNQIPMANEGTFQHLIQKLHEISEETLNDSAQVKHV